MLYLVGWANSWFENKGERTFEERPQKNCSVGSILIHDLQHRLDCAYIQFVDGKLGGIASSLASLPLEDIMAT